MGAHISPRAKSLFFTPPLSFHCGNLSYKGLPLISSQAGLPSASHATGTDGVVRWRVGVHLDFKDSETRESREEAAGNEILGCRQRKVLQVMQDTHPEKEGTSSPWFLHQTLQKSTLEELRRNAAD
ncbi:hypothetical protein E2320_021859 [Naja naja]|nr:hypothetical protein E2320_021859 [Naja naja]